MEEMRKTRNSLLAAKVIKGLESRHMAGYFVETKEEALKKALELIPEGSSISWGGATSASEIGLLEAVKKGNYTVYDRADAKDEEEKKAIVLKAFGCDWFISGTNAITEDGILVNLDGNSNRVACLAYGPEHVIIIAGMNKVAKDVDAAIYRVRNEAAPINAQRFPINTPCKLNGACGNCKSPDSICCQMLITRLEHHPGRVHVILVNDSLGF
ncbi:MAG: lactate utilization protein [Eubacterium sp.]|nr:lactate utilization protein [Eubacterium sp.]